VAPSTGRYAKLAGKTGQHATADQFDAVIHVDETRAVEPLERTAHWEEVEVPETYPFTV
jgi:hypothetical protein